MCMFLFLFFIFFCGCVFFFFSKAIEKASENRAIVEALGEPIVRGPWYNASLAVAHRRHSVSCTFPVSGPQGTGIFQLKAVRQGGRSNRFLNFTIFHLFSPHSAVPFRAISIVWFYRFVFPPSIPYDAFACALSMRLGRSLVQLLVYLIYNPPLYVVPLVVPTNPRIIGFK